MNGATVATSALDAANVAPVEVVHTSSSAMLNLALWKEEKKSGNQRARNTRRSRKEEEKKEETDYKGKRSLGDNDSQAGHEQEALWVATGDSEDSKARKSPLLSIRSWGRKKKSQNEFFTNDEFGNRIVLIPPAATRGERQRQAAERADEARTMLNQVLSLDATSIASPHQLQQDDVTIHEAFRRAHEARRLLDPPTTPGLQTVLSLESTRGEQAARKALRVIEEAAQQQFDTHLPQDVDDDVISLREHKPLKLVDELKLYTPRHVLETAEAYARTARQCLETILPHIMLLEDNTVLVPTAQKKRSVAVKEESFPTKAIPATPHSQYPDISTLGFDNTIQDRTMTMDDYNINEPYNVQLTEVLSTTSLDQLLDGNTNNDEAAMAAAKRNSQHKSGVVPPKASPQSERVSELIKAAAVVTLQQAEHRPVQKTMKSQSDVSADVAINQAPKERLPAISESSKLEESVVPESQALNRDFPSTNKESKANPLASDAVVVGQVARLAAPQPKLEEGEQSQPVVQDDDPSEEGIEVPYSRKAKKTTAQTALKQNPQGKSQSTIPATTAALPPRRWGFSLKMDAQRKTKVVAAAVPPSLPQPKQQPIAMTAKVSKSEAVVSKASRSAGKSPRTLSSPDMRLEKSSTRNMLPYTIVDVLQPLNQQQKSGGLNVTDRMDRSRATVLPTAQPEGRSPVVEKAKSQSEVAPPGPHDIPSTNIASIANPLDSDMVVVEQVSRLGAPQPKLDGVGRDQTARQEDDHNEEGIEVPYCRKVRKTAEKAGLKQKPQSKHESKIPATATTSLPRRWGVQIKTNEQPRARVLAAAAPASSPPKQQPVVKTARVDKSRGAILKQTVAVKSADKSLPTLSSLEKRLEKSSTRDILPDPVGDVQRTEVKSKIISKSYDPSGKDGMDGSRPESSPTGATALPTAQPVGLSPVSEKEKSQPEVPPDVAAPCSQDVLLGIPSTNHGSNANLTIDVAPLLATPQSKLEEGVQSRPAGQDDDPSEEGVEVPYSRKAKKTTATTNRNIPSSNEESKAPSTYIESNAQLTPKDAPLFTAPAELLASQLGIQQKTPDKFDSVVTKTASNDRDDSEEGVEIPFPNLQLSEPVKQKGWFLWISPSRSTTEVKDRESKNANQQKNVKSTKKSSRDDGDVVDKADTTQIQSSPLIIKAPSHFEKTKDLRTRNKMTNSTTEQPKDVAEGTELHEITVTATEKSLSYRRSSNSKEMPTKKSLLSFWSSPGRSSKTLAVQETKLRVGLVEKAHTTGVDAISTNADNEGGFQKSSLNESHNDGETSELRARQMRTGNKPNKHLVNTGPDDSGRSASTGRDIGDKDCALLNPAVFLETAPTTTDKSRTEINRDSCTKTQRTGQSQDGTTFGDEKSTPQTSNLSCVSKDSNANAEKPKETKPTKSWNLSKSNNKEVEAVPPSEHPSSYEETGTGQNAIEHAQLLTVVKAERSYEGIEHPLSESRPITGSKTPERAKKVKTEVPKNRKTKLGIWNSRGRSTRVALDQERKASDPENQILVDKNISEKETIGEAGKQITKMDNETKMPIVEKLQSLAPIMERGLSDHVKSEDVKKKNKWFPSKSTKSDGQMSAEENRTREDVVVVDNRGADGETSNEVSYGGVGKATGDGVEASIVAPTPMETRRENGKEIEAPGGIDKARPNEASILVNENSLRPRLSAFSPTVSKDLTLDDVMSLKTLDDRYTALAADFESVAASPRAQPTAKVPKISAVDLMPPSAEFQNIRQVFSEDVAADSLGNEGDDDSVTSERASRPLLLAPIEVGADDEAMVDDRKALNYAALLASIQSGKRLFSDKLREPQQPIAYTTSFIDGDESVSESLAQMLDERRQEIVKEKEATEKEVTDTERAAMRQREEEQPIKRPNAEWSLLCCRGTGVVEEAHDDIVEQLSTDSQESSAKSSVPDDEANASDEELVTMPSEDAVLTNGKSPSRSFLPSFRRRRIEDEESQESPASSTVQDDDAVAEIESELYPSVTERQTMTTFGKSISRSWWSFRHGRTGDYEVDAPLLPTSLDSFDQDESAFDFESRDDETSASHDVRRVISYNETAKRRAPAASFAPIEIGADGDSTRHRNVLVNRAELTSALNAHPLATSTDDNDSFATPTSIRDDSAMDRVKQSKTFAALVRSMMTKPSSITSKPSSYVSKPSSSSKPSWSSKPSLASKSTSS
jgi:hypothetical protein